MGLEVRPRKDLGCGLPSRLEVRPVGGDGVRTRLTARGKTSPSDAQPSAGRRLEVRVVEETGCGLASPLEGGSNISPSDAQHCPAISSKEA